MGLSQDNLTRLRALVGDSTFTARFDVEREIGHGGMGRVYAGTEREGGKQIAIKVLDPGLHGDPVRFATEAAMLEQLDHPMIVRYVAHGLTSDGRAYLAMQWLEGETLGDRLKREPVSIGDAIVIGQRVADALAYLHEHQIVHRDIKPSNVYLVAGDPKAAIVIDLGIAKRLSVIGPTKTGEVIGTPGYMAPEQVRGESDIDERVDLFALGCMLYETVTGTRPFGGDQVVEVLARLLLSEPQPLDVVRPDVPGRLATLVAVLLAKRADDRTIDAEQASRELATIARGIAANDTATLARSPWNRPHSLDDSAHAATVRAPSKRSRLPLVLGIAGVVVAGGVVAIVMAMRRDPAPKVAAVAPGDADVVRAPIVLPDDIDLARKPGPLVKGTIVDKPVADQLGVSFVDAAWCPARKRVVLATLDGKQTRLAGFDRETNAIESIATLAHSEKGGATSIACLPSGRILVVTGGLGYSIDGATVAKPTPFPPTTNDAAAIGATARWLVSADPATRGSLLEWNGDGPPRQVREVCESPRRLAPDGNKVACIRNNRVVVDDGKAQLEGPSGSDATWSADSATLYVTASPGIYRWHVARRGARSYIAQSGPSRVVEVGSWAATVAFPNHMARHWVGRGTRELLPLEIGASYNFVTTIPEHGEVVIALGSMPIELRAVAIERGPPLLMPVGLRTQHYSQITTIAFDPAGTAILTRSAGDRATIVRSLADGKRRPLEVASNSSGPTGNFVSWRADGTIALVGAPGLGYWDRAGKLQRVNLNPSGFSGAIAGMDELVVWNAEGIQELALDGKRGAWLARTEATKNASWIEIDPARRFALVKSSIVGSNWRVLDLRAARPIIELDSQHRPNQGALVFGDQPVLVVADNKGQVFAIAGAKVTPLAKLTYVRAIAAPPVGRRVAIASGREVIVFDVDREVEVMRGALTATVTALAWSRKGDRLAAAADNTELTVFDVP